MGVLDGVLDYLRTYEPLKSMTLDYLRAGEAESLRVSPTEPVLRTYLDGTELRQYLMTLWLRRGYGEPDEAQIENFQWFSDFERWLAAQNRQKIFPSLGEGRTPKSLCVLETASAQVIGDDGLAAYPVTLRLVYEQAET